MPNHWGPERGNITADFQREKIPLSPVPTRRRLLLLLCFDPGGVGMLGTLGIGVGGGTLGSLLRRVLFAFALNLSRSSRPVVVDYSALPGIISFSSFCAFWLQLQLLFLLLRECIRGTDTGRRNLARLFVRP